jgi:type I restriction enzyme M protein
MLNVLQRSELHDHLARSMVAVADVLRSESPVGQVADAAAQLLLDRAVTVVAEQRGSDVTSLAQPQTLDIATPPLGGRMHRRSMQSTELAIDRILLQEDDWLGTHPQLLTEYGNELLRIAARFGDTPEHITSRALEDVVRRVLGGFMSRLGGDHISVLDPACGAATLLNAATDSIESKTVKIYGQDINANIAHRAAQNLFIAGRDATIMIGDLFAEDIFPERFFDIMVADAPYGLRWHLTPDIANDTRFQLGLPPKSDSTFLFIQAMLAKLKPADQGGGIGIFFTNVSTLTSSDSSISALRQKITDLDILHAIIALPEGLNVRTDIRLYALVFNSKKADKWKGQTQVIDLRARYEDNRSGPEKRRLTDQALKELEKVIATPRESAVVRMVTPASFSFRRLELRRPNQTGAAQAEIARRGEYRVLVPAETDSQNWLTTRYPLGVHPEVYNIGGVETRWDVDQVFPSRDRQAVLSSLKQIGWPTTRLSAFTSQMNYLRSASAPERAEELARLAGGKRLLVPVEAAHAATAGDPQEVASPHRCLVLDLLAGLDPSFLAGWLNSAAGRLARLAASAATGFSSSPRAVSIADAWTLMDETIVPVPDLAVQEVLAAVGATLAAGHRRLGELDALMWQSPDAVGEVRRTARKLLTTGDLHEWAETLPYPLAAALRTAETRGSDDAAVARQLLHFWEATIIFLASYLLGALHQDKSLWDAEIPLLIETLRKENLSFERTSFGTWKVTIERLSRLFRDGLNPADPDEEARFRQLLGNPSRDLTRRILSTDVVRLVNTANATRNTMDGHGATMSSRHDRAHRASWETLTEELGDIVGSGMAEFRLLRAGRMDFDGINFRIDIEVLLGPATPFVQEQLSTARPLSAGGLYLASSTGDVTPIAPFIRIGNDTDDADYTCYFYNRREQDGERMVAYHLASENEITAPSPKIADFIDALNYSASQIDSGPDLSPLSLPAADKQGHRTGDSL